MRGWRLAVGKEPTLGTREGGRSLFNRRGRRARDLLGRGPSSRFLCLAARARTGGDLCIAGGGGGGIVRVEVAGGEGREVIRAPSEFSGFVRVGVQLGVLPGVSESLAKCRIVKRYELFRVLSRSGGLECSSPFLPHPSGGGPCGSRGGGWGLACGGRRLEGLGGGS